ncbi:MAG: ASKHA domain-containing protein [Paludibacter sp.]
MTKHKVHLQPLGKTIQVNDYTPLMDVLHEFGIEFPCAGKGTCGKCKIKLLQGEIEISEIHQQKLDTLQLPPEWRLACYSQCTTDITLEVEQFNHLILADESEFHYIPQQGFGVAIDLGTTTLVAQLVDLSTAKVLAVETMLNPQAKFGADLISRVQAYLNGKGNEMTRLIRQSIGNMIELLIKKQAVEIQRISIVGNTVMQLIFSNCDLSPLAQYPFHTNNLGSKLFTAHYLGWNFNVIEDVMFYPSIGSFVGSDILAGIVATGLHKKENYTALIDLGTNGEIVVGNKQQIVCASTAAGPAFEGTNISMGMRAVTGAISSVKLESNELNINVIGNTEAKGICGSALVDAIAIFRQLDLIGMFGEINSGENFLSLKGNVGLTQKDINEFQLAKAAIAAGLEILCNTISIQLNDIQEVYIAGGFGNYINISHLIETGMIEMPENRIHKMGNTALIGAKMFLFSDNHVTEEILAKTLHINLESDPNFQNIYVDKMLFN